jgi:hypothetical protein
MTEHKKQADRILELLQKHRGEFVPLPVIMRLGIASHTRRLHELRKEWVIEIQDIRAGGERHTAYKLVGPIEKQLTMDENWFAEARA